MRILQVIETLGHGGAETVATNLTIGLSAGPDRGLADSGHDHELRLIHCSRVNGCASHQPFIDRMRAADAPVFDVHWRELMEPGPRASIRARRVGWM